MTGSDRAWRMFTNTRVGIVQSSLAVKVVRGRRYPARRFQVLHEPCRRDLVPVARVVTRATGPMVAHPRSSEREPTLTGQAPTPTAACPLRS
jgi:hypothetical protein